MGNLELLEFAAVAFGREIVHGEKWYCRRLDKAQSHHTRFAKDCY